MRVRAAGDGIAVDRVKLAPAQVEVTLTGALLAVEKAKEALTPYVKVTAAELAGALGKDGRPREVDIQIDGLPPGIGVKLSPERVRLVQNPGK